MSGGEDRASSRVLAIWGLFAVSAAAVAVTYARLSPEELYNVSVGGVAGGFGRALVFLNFPTALVGVVLALIAVDRLSGKGYAIAASVSIALCAIVVLPGVVDQDDLDAKAINALPAIGVLGALVLTIVAARSGNATRAGAPRPTTRLRAYPGKARAWLTDRADFVTTLRRNRRRGSAVAVPTAAILVIASLPWIAAELGFYLDGPFLGSELRPEPGQPALRAVHLGHHHGTDGSLLALTAIALGVEPARMRRRALCVAVAAFLSLMLAYGLANAVQDFWGEQIVKRGWADERLPSVLHPDASLAWLGIVIAAALAYRLLYRPVR